MISYKKKISLFIILFCLLAFAVVQFFKKDSYQYQLSVVTIFQNEARFLREWIDFYRVQGVEHFYLFNNLSDDDYLEVLDPYIQKGIVELFNWPYAVKPGCQSDWRKVQSAAYRLGLDFAKGESKWVAIIDTDEFAFPKKKSNLVEFLKDYEECSGILINWQLFGTSMISRIPDNQLMMETLLLRAPSDAEINRSCKTIVRPHTVKYCVHPYSVIYFPWSYAVDPDKRAFHWELHKSHPIKTDKIQINHYWARDEEFFFTNKLARFEKWGSNKKQACIQQNAEANELIDQEILPFAKLVRRLQKKEKE